MREISSDLLRKTYLVQGARARTFWHTPPQGGLVQTRRQLSQTIF